MNTSSPQISFQIFPLKSENYQGTCDKKEGKKGIKETHTHKDDVLSSFLATLLHGWDCGTVGE